MKKILFFCTGNVCKSFMAEGILKKIAQDIGSNEIKCKSAGINIPEVMQISENEIIFCEEIGINIRSNNFAVITAEFLKSEKFDLYVAIDEHDYQILNQTILSESILEDDEIHMQLPSKVHILISGIQNQCVKDLDIYKVIYDEIKTGVVKLVPKLFDMEISKMEERHLDTVALLERESFARPWSKNALAEEVDNPNGVFLVAHFGDLIVGYVGMHYVIDEGFIANLAVFTEFRNIGVGAMLLEKLDTFARDNNFSRLALEVRSKNAPAIALYEKIGYKSDGIRKNYYTDPIDDVIMMSKIY